MNISDTTFVLKDIISKLELNVAYINDTMYKNNNNHDSWCLGLFDDFFDKFADKPWCDIGILVAFIFILYFLVIKNGKIQKFVTNNLGIIAVIIAAMGTFLYFAGFNEKGCANNVFALFLRSVLSSMELFVSHSDLIEVRHACHESSTYMTLFSLTHFIAVMVSAVFIIRLLGLQFVSKISLFLWRISFCVHKRDVFVFWGLNQNSVRLAKNIYELRGKKCRIIFINLLKEHHTHSSRFTFSHFFHSANEDVEKYASEIDEIGAVLLNAKKSFNDISFSKETELFKELGISYCDGLIGKTLNKGKNKVEYYILSDVEKDNIAAMIMLKDYLGKNQEKGNERKLNLDKFSCYCHVRKNNVNMALLDDGFKYNIHYIDSSSLSVLQLKKNVEYHPVKFVDVNTKTGMVTSDFTAMIIGFGEVGRDVFRFLYEFSSFVCDNFGTESPKYFHIVDDNLKSLKADFLNDAPALNDKTNINWLDHNTHSQEFWTMMRDAIDRLNYIVVALDNDEEAISVAVDISEFAYRYRKDIENKFRIFVRIKDMKMYGSIKAIKPNCIHPFGADEDIFKYKTVSEDVVEDGAKEFYYEYQSVAVEIDKDIEVMDKLKEYSSDHSKLWQWRREYNGGKLRDNTKDDLIELHYKEEQDKSNCFHVLTKRCMAGVNANCHNEGGWAEFFKNNPVLHKSLYYCEHLRWNAKMELLGFEYAEKIDKYNEKGEEVSKDYRRRQHKCMIGCAELEFDKNLNYTIYYDKKVVELSVSDKYTK